MAGSRRNSQAQTPERVKNAAQAMNHSSGIQRGYVPPDTGTFRTQG